ncbi:MAG: hypothetical protein ONA90_08940 [candidate division KSB1 bacterium]|nr:hypothetical protein [candidate division KSB1 bacterium]
MMNNQLKRLTAASLVAVLLLVGFVAEYAHRHAMPSAGPAEFVQGNNAPSGQSNFQQKADFCFVCQLHAAAAEFSADLTLFVLNAGQYVGIFEQVVFASFASPYTFLRRGPPAFLA